MTERFRSDNRKDNLNLSTTEEQPRLIDHATKPPENRGVEPSPRLQQLREEGGVSRQHHRREETEPFGLHPTIGSYVFRQQETSFSSGGASKAWKEITDAEKRGDIIGAYSIAKNASNYYKANILARDHNIAGHEYTEIIHFQGNNIIQDVIECLKSRLTEGATASKLGFNGFNKKTVADIGGREGNYIPLFRELGAESIYVIDPNKEAINTAVEKGLLSSEHAIPTTLEDMPENLKGTFDVATVFNLDPQLARNERFIQSIRDALPSHGQVIMTVVETENHQDVLPLMHKYFNVRSQQLWERKPQVPHTYLIIADQKSS